MIRHRATLVWQLVLAVSMQLISWVPLGRWNYQPCCPPALQVLLIGTVVSGTRAIAAGRHP